MKVRFTKMHGLGNDFVVIDDRAEELDLSADDVRFLCDRNFGIGADGVMLVRPAVSPDADFGWWFRNSDGSVAEMCGNGIRCFARYLVEHGCVEPDRTRVTVETTPGLYSIDIVRDESGGFSGATVDMGEPILRSTDVPTTLAPNRAESVVDGALTIDGEDLRVTCVSMGNPHCVIFVDDVESAPVGSLGPLVETDEAFPRKTNVEFASVEDRSHIRLRVWERGVGETLACGTGACATVVAASLNGLTDRSVRVSLPGGELDIVWSEEGHVFMTGPACEVFQGNIRINGCDQGR